VRLWETIVLRAAIFYFYFFSEEFWTGRVFIWRRQRCLAARIHQPGLLLFQFIMLTVKSCSVWLQA
jgi:hypothetical protein